MKEIMSRLGTVSRGDLRLLLVQSERPRLRVYGRGKAEPRPGGLSRKMETASRSRRSGTACAPDAARRALRNEGERTNLLVTLLPGQQEVFAVGVNP